MNTLDHIRADMIWPLGYTTFSCSTHLSMKFIVLINVIMPTIVGILTFISMIKDFENVSPRLDPLLHNR